MTRRVCLYKSVAQSPVVFGNYLSLRDRGVEAVVPAAKKVSRRHPKSTKAPLRTSENLTLLRCVLCGRGGRTTLRHVFLPRCLFRRRFVFRGPLILGWMPGLIRIESLHRFEFFQRSRATIFLINGHVRADHKCFHTRDPILGRSRRQCAVEFVWSEMLGDNDRVNERRHRIFMRSGLIFSLLSVQQESFDRCNPGRSLSLAESVVDAFKLKLW